MRILLITYFFPPAYSGEATYTSELACGLQAKGHHVTVLAAATGQTVNAQLPRWVHLIPDPPGPSRYTQFEEYRQCYTRAAEQVAMELARDAHYDLVHVQEWFGAEAALEVARALRIPCVKTLHFIPSQMSIGFTDRYNRANVWQRYLCHEADAVIAVSRSIRELAIAEYGVPPENVVVVYNGVSTQRFQHATREQLLSNPNYRFLEDDRTKLVVLLGRLNVQKGIDLLLRSVPSVLQRVEHVHWVICGGTSGAEDALSQYRAMADGFEGRVTFTGHVPREQALGWLMMSNVVVAPSRFEPFGLSVLEAMLCAKPVIAADVGGLSELVVHRQSGVKLTPVVAPSGWREVDPTELADAQVDLLQNCGQARQLGRAAQRRAEGLFSFDRFIQGTIGVYQQALDGFDRVARAYT